jgi:ABC-2 type transport system permease protein
MFVFVPGPVRVFSAMSAADGLGHFALAHVILAINAATMFAIAFMFSCFNMKPAAATIVALTFLLANLVLENMPFFEDYKEFCLTNHFRCWLLVFNQPIQWPEIFKSLSVIAAFNLTAFLVGLAAFHVRDIKS